jgi:hypothetical protein
MRRASLALVALSLMFPGAGLAAGVPPAGGAATPSSGASGVQCSLAACVANVQRSGPARRRTVVPVEDAYLADFFLFVLFAALLVLVPVVVTRQREARKAQGRPNMRLVKSNPEANGPKLDQPSATGRPR